jgi:hypothetical protein
MMNILVGSGAGKYPIYHPKVYLLMLLHPRRIKLQAQEKVVDPRLATKKSLDHHFGHIHSNQQYYLNFLNTDQGLLPLLLTPF